MLQRTFTVAPRSSLLKTCECSKFGHVSVEHGAISDSILQTKATLDQVIPPPRWVLANVPNLMILDDHDIRGLKEFRCVLNEPRLAKCDSLLDAVLHQ